MTLQRLTSHYTICGKEVPVPRDLFALGIQKCYANTDGVPESERKRVINGFWRLAKYTVQSTATQIKHKSKIASNIYKMWIRKGRIAPRHFPTRPAPFLPWCYASRDPSQHIFRADLLFAIHTPERSQQCSAPITLWHIDTGQRDQHQHHLVLNVPCPHGSTAEQEYDSAGPRPHWWFGVCWVRHLHCRMWPHSYSVSRSLCS
jgi:hypothetical protein